jgi:hypothetical protein
MVQCGWEGSFGSAPCAFTAKPTPPPTYLLTASQVCVLEYWIEMSGPADRSCAAESVLAQIVRTSYSADVTPRMITNVRPLPTQTKHDTPDHARTRFTRA